jgi:hypothetical protein
VKANLICPWCRVPYVPLQENYTLNSYESNEYPLQMEDHMKKDLISFYDNTGTFKTYN